MSMVILALGSAAAFICAIAVFAFAANRGQGGPSVLIIAMAVALAVFGASAAVAWVVDPPQPAHAMEVRR